MSKNIYHHTIDLKKIKIINAPKEEFMEALTAIEYRGFEVEQLSDGRRIVIVKPGGKQSYGRIAKEDFFVFIYKPEDNSLWQITHRQIFEDLEEKGKENPKATIEIINALERVYNGEEPDLVITHKLTNPAGEDSEAILKAYKWIWGQEDVNYPPPKFIGRKMSWEGWWKEDGEWYKTGAGIFDLRENIKKKIINEC